MSIKELILIKKQYFKLLCHLNGCSFGEAASKCEIVQNYNPEARTFNFIHGNLKGKVYLNKDGVICIGDHIQVFNQDILKYSDVITSRLIAAWTKRELPYYEYKVTLFF